MLLPQLLPLHPLIMPSSYTPSRSTNHHATPTPLRGRLDDPVEDDISNERSTRTCDVHHLQGLDDVCSNKSDNRLTKVTLTNSYVSICYGISSSSMPHETLHGTECSMCGDVGINEDLFQCKRCLYRYQHLYCSRSYPNFGSEKWVCDWCLYTEAIRIEPTESHGINLKRKRADGKINTLEFLQSLPEVGNTADKVVLPKCVSKAGAADVPGGQIPKRQRCSHFVDRSKVKALEKWRQIAKDTLQRKPSKGVGRRYKLLADVLF